MPDSGLVEFQIEANRSVKSYILRPRGLELFDDAVGHSKYYGGFPEARKNYSQEVRLPFEGSWYLLIVNEDQRNSARIMYEVRFSSPKLGYGFGTAFVCNRGLA